MFRKCTAALANPHHIQAQGVDSYRELVICPRKIRLSFGCREFFLENNITLCASRRSLNTLFAFLSFRTLWAGWTRITFWSLDALDSLRTGWTLRSSISFRSLDTLCTRQIYDVSVGFFSFAIQFSGICSLHATCVDHDEATDTQSVCCISGIHRRHAFVNLFDLKRFPGSPFLSFRPLDALWSLWTGWTLRSDYFS